MVEFAWSHTVISDQLYERVKTACDFRLSPTSTECGHVMDLLYHTYDEIDIYNVYAPKCNTDDGSAPLPSSSSSADDSSASVRNNSIDHVDTH
jgi:serine carboxypeptidase-like clade II